MKTLNLVYPEKSEINFKISKFPDGQQNVKIDRNSLDEKFAPIGNGNEVLLHNSVQIKSRLNNFMDLELITCVVKSLRNLGISKIHLYTPYFLGSRSDRKFEEGSNNYLKEVICPIVNELGFDSVTVLDPHSDVIEACLNGFIKIDNIGVVESFISDTNAFLDGFVLVSPDGGSLKKIYKVAEQINYTGDVVICSKQRGEDGKISKTVVPDSLEYISNNKNFVIIDDIIDGGRTFIEIAKVIKEQIAEYNKTHELNKSKIYLIVSHGIFSKGFGELMQYFDAIYTTNSYQDFMPDTIEFVKQRNVF